MQIYKVLIIDDDEDIHETLITILEEKVDPNLKPEIFKDEDATIKFTIEPDTLDYKIVFDSAYQGKEGIKKYQEALKSDNCFDLVICDMKMEPGINGLETMRSILDLDPNAFQVLCSAFSDYSVDELRKELRTNSQLGIIEKPFNSTYVRNWVFVKLETRRNSF